MLSDSYIRFCVSRVSSIAILTIWLILFPFACSEDSDAINAEATGAVASEVGSVRFLNDRPGNSTWSADSSSLFFVETIKDSQEAEIRRFDLSTNEFSSLYKGAKVGLLALNDNNEIFAPTFIGSGNSFCLVTPDGTDCYHFKELDIVNSPTWLTGSEKVIFSGCGRQGLGVFLWNRSSNALERITPISSESHQLNDGYHYTYQSFAPSFFAQRVIFGYAEVKVNNQKSNITFHLGATDLKTGKCWKITDLANFKDLLRWYSSETEDAVYFFKWNDSGLLDSLWRVKSDGMSMSKVLDGTVIGKADIDSCVSWSNGGNKFLISYYDYDEKRWRSNAVETKTGEVRNLDLGVSTNQAALSPNGNKLAYIDQKELYVLDLTNDSKRRIFP